MLAVPRRRPRPPGVGRGAGQQRGRRRGPAGHPRRDHGVGARGRLAGRPTYHSNNSSKGGDRRRPRPGQGGPPNSSISSNSSKGGGDGIPKTFFFGDEKVNSVCMCLCDCLCWLIFFCFHFLSIFSLIHCFSLFVVTSSPFVFLRYNYLLMSARRTSIFFITERLIALLIPCRRRRRRRFPSPPPPLLPSPGGIGDSLCRQTVECCGRRRVDYAEKRDIKSRISRARARTILL